MTNARSSPSAFKIGLAVEDIDTVSVSVVHVEAIRMRKSETERCTARKDKFIRPKRVVESDFGDVTGRHAQVKVVDRVTLDGWEFKVGVEARFIFTNGVNRWELEGRDARRMLVGLCLPHSCEVIAYLTSKVGLRPLILPPAVPEE